ncbi:RING-H2 finger protein ATL74-like [Chenopodium quinoa]|uniref:RING-type E3 ubiquitin transferase n=1 Tax=Chenopodium quinoa TaxID=63459 RepID=A0A803MHY1_CHEQI|nr:RING-H2 finger protein ATL74-like [Chenopodium quinoa]
MMMHRKLLEIAVAAPTTTNNRTGAPSNMDTQLTQANFDTNMVIILAALLCALICALGLNSMVRCILRCGPRFGMETAEQAAARMSATGLKKSALKKIPVAVYGADGSKGGSSDMSMDPSDDTECPICLGEFIDGDKVRVLPKCNHRFHVSCIDTWLGSHSSCPNCRLSLLETIGSTSKAAGGDIINDEGSQSTPPLRDGGDRSGRQDHVVVEVSSGGS